MQFIRALDQLGKGDTKIAGGKGASLGEMLNSDMPVPDGFVVTSVAFEKFLEETGIKTKIDSLLSSVKHANANSAEKASKKIRSIIMQEKIPAEINKEIILSFKTLDSECVAVRSSATIEDSAGSAWAGQLETYLNTKEPDLLGNIRRCWASLFMPRALFYRFERNLHAQEISIAVVVQKMVESEVSGVAFSVNPVTQDENQLVIEAGYGLGEAIVSGQITPDSYIISKESFRVTERKVNLQKRGIFKSKKGSGWRKVENGDKQKLSEKQIMELASIVIKIEEHYRFPVDVEWALENGKFYITQSRPITTLSRKNVVNNRKSKK